MSTKAIFPQEMQSSTGNTRPHAIAGQLRKQILNATILPDTRLQEVLLASQFNSSRTPIREALRLLEQEQLVVCFPNRGYVVRRFRRQDILDDFEVRATLEGMACRIVAEKGLRPAAFGRLVQLSGEMQEVSEASDGEIQLRKWFELNFQFHRIFIEATGNEMLDDAIQKTQRLPAIFDENNRLRSETSAKVGRLFDAADIRRAYLEHESIIEAVRSRQSGRAEFLMRGHILRNQDSVRRRFGEIFHDEK
jgi:GntR family transcriptional regulator of vanillate catabolism